MSEAARWNLSPEPVVRDEYVERWKGKRDGVILPVGERRAIRTVIVSLLTGRL